MKAETLRPVALVTGGRGFLGRRVVAALRYAGYAAKTIGAARPGDTDQHYPVDWLNDSRGLTKILQTLQPALVVHLAAAPPPACLATHQHVTIAGTRTLIAALTDAPATLMLAVGSAAEFGIGLPDAGLLKDDHPCRPATPYGHAKHAASKEVLAYRASGGRASVLRLFTACGPGPPPHSLIGRLVSQLHALPREGGVLRIAGFERIRDYLPVDGVAAMIVQLAKHGSALPPVMNLCSGNAMSVRQWADALINAYGLPVRLLPALLTDRRDDPARVVGDPATLISLGITLPSLMLSAMAAAILRR